MKLFWSSRSPFVRKVMICAHELDLVSRLTLERVAVKPEEPNMQMLSVNPLGKIPALVLDDETVLYDSPVVCEYLASLVPGNTLFPADSSKRWVALRRQALADGMMDLALARSGEARRDHPSAQHKSAFELKVAKSLDLLASEASQLSVTSPSIGEISICCALAYLDSRYADDRWRDKRAPLATWFDQFSKQPSVVATAFEDIR